MYFMSWRAFRSSNFILSYLWSEKWQHNLHFYNTQNPPAYFGSIHWKKMYVNLITDILEIIMYFKFLILMPKYHFEHESRRSQACKPLRKHVKHVNVIPLWVVTPSASSSITHWNFPTSDCWNHQAPLVSNFNNSWRFYGWLFY